MAAKTLTHHVESVLVIEKLDKVYDFRHGIQRSNDCFAVFKHGQFGYDCSVSV